MFSFFLILSIKPSDGLCAGFVDVSAFVPDLLMCRPSCQKCGCRPSCRRFSCRFWKPPRAGEVLPKFLIFLYTLYIFICHSHPMPSLFCSMHRGQRPTMSEGCQDRTACYAHLDRCWDRKLGRPNPRRHRTLDRRRELPWELFLCIELVNLE